VSQYKPQFTVTDKIQRLKGQITKQAKKGSFIHATNQMYHNASLRDICSSLALENTTFSLTLSQVTDIIDGGIHIGNADEIRAVKSAYKAYSAIYHRHYELIDVYSTAEMLGAHNTFMAGFSKGAGCYRSVDIENIGQSQVNVASPAKLVSSRIDDLFAWVKASNEDILIKSCIFHHELMSIRPFSDGSGLVARMWQTLLNMQSWFLPVRMPLWDVVRERQQEYYDILAIPNKADGSTKFIEFMLQAVKDAIAEFEKDPTK